MEKNVFKNFDIAKCDVLKQTKQNLKTKAKIEEFVSKMKSVLDTIDKDGMKKYNIEIVKFVIESAEHVFTKPKSGDIKKSVSIEILKSFFDDNEELIERFIDMGLKDIEKSTRWTRARNFFFRVAQVVCLCQKLYPI